MSHVHVTCINRHSAYKYSAFSPKQLEHTVAVGAVGV